MRYLLVAIASLGGLLFGYETGVAAGALPWAQFTWSNTWDDQVLLSSGTLLGALIGALAAGRVADLVGRRDVIMTTTALFTLGAFVSAIAPSGFVLLIGRLVVGIGVGAISVAAPLYIAEIAPAASRGKMICSFQLMVTIGILLAYVGAEVASEITDGWRFLLGASAVPGLILSALALLLLESPVWLELQGDHQSANAVRVRLGGEDSVPGVAALAEIPALPAQPDTDELSKVFSRSGRAGVLVGIGLFFVQQFVGINAIFYYSNASLTKLAEMLSFDLEDAAGLSLSLINVAATLVAFPLIDRIGRRRLLLFSLVGIAVGLVVMAVGAGRVWIGGADILSAAGVYVFIVSFAVGLGPIPWVVAAELLPIRVRGLAMAVVVASHWLFDSLASPTGLLLRDEFGRPVLLLLYAGMAVAGIVIFRRRLPETKGLSLVAIDRHLTTWAARVRETRGHYLVATLGTVANLLAGYNLAITAVTLVLITEEWQLTAFEQGLLASTLVAGLTVGVFIAGPQADRFGRRYVLMSTAALFVVGALGAAISPSFGWLLLARMASGWAIGVSAPTSAVFVAEVAPERIRGRLLSFGAVAYALGTIAAYCVGLALVHHHQGWRLMFGFAALPATIYGLAMLPLPESPRWLAATGRVEAARRSLRRLVGDNADRQLAAITTEGHETAPSHRDSAGGWAQLWLREHRPAVWIGLSIMFLTVFSGEDMVLFYAPTILKQIGFANTSVSFAATLGLGLVTLVMTVISLGVVDAVGRRPMVIIGLFVLAASMLALGTLNAIDPHASSPLVRWGQVAALAVFVGAFALALGPVAEIVVAEIYPQTIRGRATGLAHGTRSVSAIVFSLIFPLLLVAPGLAVTVLGFASISLAGALFMLRGLPETKGRSLEEIGEFWERHAQARRVGQSSTP